MNTLATHYLGLALRSPLVCSASPLTEELSLVRQMEDAGAGAVVLPSLFEEQLAAQGHAFDSGWSASTLRDVDASPLLPQLRTYNLGPDGYLDYIRRVKDAVSIPVIASLNGSSPGGWLRFARRMEEAGADAIELQLYHLPTDPAATAALIENRYLSIAGEVARSVKIPVAVKLSSQFTAVANLAHRLDGAGIRGLVLFNRFYQPDFDLERMEVVPQLALSTPDELLLRLHWAAILYGHVRADLAITGGVHTAEDVIKCLLAGAPVAMLTSALYEYGIDHLRTIEHDLLEWLESHRTEQILDLLGKMSLRALPDPSTFERLHHLKVLRSFTSKVRH